MCTPTRRRPAPGPCSAAVAAALLGAASAALAQPCTPAWSGAAGVPGIDTSAGYVGPMATWTDGQGEALFAGGSFPRIDNVNGTRFIARWDRVADRWTPLASGLNPGNTNGFVAAIRPFTTPAGPRLIVGGFFDNASGVGGTRSLVQWDGQRWESMNAQLAAPQSVWALRPWDDGGGEKLYIGGGISSIGGVAANGIASWDGTAYTPLGDGITGSFSPTVFALEAFDDGSGNALYVGGRFDAAGGVNRPLLARWRNGAWSTVGTGLVPTQSTGQVSAMTVFDDGSGPALFVGGGSFRLAGGPTVSVAKWDGQRWSAVGPAFGGIVYFLAGFDDGSGPKLYAGGTAQPGTRWFARFENGAWVPVGGGMNNSVFGGTVWDDAIYVGGNFSTAGTEAARGIAAWTGCGACPADFNGDGTLDSDDFFDFLNAFNAQDASADFNADGVVDSDDFFDFLNAYNTGC